MKYIYISVYCLLGGGAVCGETTQDVFKLRYETMRLDFRFPSELWMIRNRIISGSAGISRVTCSSSPHALMLERDQGGGVLISPSGGLETTGRSVGDDVFDLELAMNDNYRATGIVPTKTSSDVGSL